MESNSQFSTKDELFNYFIEFSTDAIIKVSSDGFIISSNEAMRILSGYSNEELLELNIDSLFVNNKFEKIAISELKDNSKAFLKTKEVKTLQVNCFLKSNADNSKFIFIKPLGQTAELLLDIKRLTALEHLNKMENATISQITSFALNKALEISGCSLGYIAFVSEDAAFITVSAWTSNIFKVNPSEIEPFTFNVSDIDIIKNVIKTKISVLENSFNGNGEKIFQTENVPLNNFMIIPVSQNEKVKMITILCNKEEDINSNNLAQVSALLVGLWTVILRTRSARKLQENEQVLIQQNEEFIAINEELNESNKRILEINEELKMAKIKAEESDMLKSSFLANMSHEIRTPMNAINGFAELLRQSGITPEISSQYIDIINANCKQLTSIIEDIIDISKIETGQITINYKRTNINELLNELGIIFESLGSSKGIGFKIDAGLKSNISYTKTDETRLRQILYNLINNAIKFTNSGSVIVGYTLKNNFLEFYIKDTGIGISKENHEIIFERFRQVESGMSRVYGGTGLGLTISRVLLELLGGRIWLDSELGNGSTFYFTIPYEAEGINEYSVSDVKLKQKYNWSDKTILIAEDEEYNFFLIHEILTDTNANLIHAKNGREAIEFCQQNAEIVLILMDIKMPEIDGYEASKIIKSFRPELPIIAQTAYAMSEDRTKALNAGCDNYISKPLNKDRLLNMISSKIDK